MSNGGAIRVLFAFDPLRQGLLLIGGDKTGQRAAWYSEAIPLADDLFDEYLRETGKGCFVGTAAIPGAVRSGGILIRGRTHR